MSGLFVPYDSLNERKHRMELASGVNAALRGEIHNTGQFSVPAGTDYYVLQDARLGVGRVIVLAPANRAAAVLQPYVPEVMNGKCEVFFVTAPADEAVFNYAIIGVGN